MEVRMRVKKFVCCDETGEEKKLAITDETWVAAGKGRNRSKKEDERSVVDVLPKESGPGAVEDLDGCVTCGRFVPGDLRESVF